MKNSTSDSYIKDIETAVASVKSRYPKITSVGAIAGMCINQLRQKHEGITVDEVEMLILMNDGTICIQDMRKKRNTNNKRKEYA